MVLTGTDRMGSVLPSRTSGGLDSPPRRDGAASGGVAAIGVGGAAAGFTCVGALALAAGVEATVACGGSAGWMFCFDVSRPSSRI